MKIEYNKVPFLFITTEKEVKVYRTQEGIVTEGGAKYLVKRAEKEDLIPFYIAHGFLSFVFVGLVIYTIILGGVSSILPALFAFIFGGGTLAVFFNSKWKAISLASVVLFLAVLLIMTFLSFNHITAITTYVSTLMVYFLMSSIPKQKPNLFKIVKRLDGGKVFTYGILVRIKE